MDNIKSPLLGKIREKSKLKYNIMIITKDKKIYEDMTRFAKVLSVQDHHIHLYAVLGGESSLITNEVQLDNCLANGAPVCIYIGEVARVNAGLKEFVHTHLKSLEKELRGEIEIKNGTFVGDNAPRKVSMRARIATLRQVWNYLATVSTQTKK